MALMYGGFVPPLAHEADRYHRRRSDTSRRQPALDPSMKAILAGSAMPSGYVDPVEAWRSELRDMARAGGGRTNRTQELRRRYRQAVMRGPQGINDQRVLKEARRLIAPAYNSQIRDLREEAAKMRDQGIQAARDVRGWYAQAGRKANKQAKRAAREGKKARRAVQKTDVKIGGGSRKQGRAEGGIDVAALRGMSKMGREFFGELGGAIAAEGAAAAGAVRRDFASRAADLTSEAEKLRRERRAKVLSSLDDVRNQLYRDRVQRLQEVLSVSPGARGQKAGREMFNRFIELRAAGHDPQSAFAATVSGNHNQAARAQLARLILRGQNEGSLGAAVGALRAENAPEPPSVSSQLGAINARISSLRSERDATLNPAEQEELSAEIKRLQDYQRMLMRSGLGLDV